MRFSETSFSPRFYPAFYDKHPDEMNKESKQLIKSLEKGMEKFEFKARHSTLKKENMDPQNNVLNLPKA